MRPLWSGSINFGLITDTYIEDLKRIIEQKAKGIKPRPKGEEPRPSNVRDFMKLLKTSIESQKTKAA
jgi:DNA end-binding protein Ku